MYNYTVTYVFVKCVLLMVEFVVVLYEHNFVVIHVYMVAVVILFLFIRSL